MFRVLVKCTRNLTNYYVHAYEAWKTALSQTKGVSLAYYGEGYPDFRGWGITDENCYRSFGGVRPEIELWCGGPGNKKPQYCNNQYILPHPVHRVPKLILLTDFWEIIRDSSLEAWRARESYLADHGVIGYFSFYPQAEPWMRHVLKSRFNTFITFPYVYDPVFNRRCGEYRWDVNLQMIHSASYPFRQHAFRMLYGRLNSFHIDKHEYKDIPGKADPLERLFAGGDPTTNFARLLNSCRITVTDGYTKYCPQAKRWQLDGSDLFNARYPQTLASASALFCPEITSNHVERLVDGTHYVAVDRANLVNKVEYYLAHPQKLAMIVRAANEWAARNCSWQVVGERLKTDLERAIK